MKARPTSLFMGVYLGEAPAAARIRQDRKVRVSLIACPDCGAGVGEDCTRLDGTPRTAPGVHIARRRMAIRKGL